jgi:hypothetical protein
MMAIPISLQDADVLVHEAPNALTDDANDNPRKRQSEDELERETISHGTSPPTLPLFF